MVEEPVVRFHPTSGRIIGVLGVVLGVLLAVPAVVWHSDGFPAWLGGFGVAFVVLSWTAVLRPAVWLMSRTLVMRNMVDVVEIPLAAIQEVSVRQVLAVTTDEGRHVSPAIGRSRLQVLRDTKPGRITESYPYFVEERIRSAADDARSSSGVGRYSEEQAALAAEVRRDWAWPEIVALAVAGVVLVASFFL
jgi:hypothetical protein